jgi:hypothetical protein
MATNGLTASLLEPVDFAGGVFKRLVRCLKAQVEDRYDACRHLSASEDRHLLDRPAAAQLAEHAGLVAELERVGRWLSLVTQSPDSPDRATAELVSLTLQDLRDRRALWHGDMTHEQRDNILRTIFGETLSLLKLEAAGFLLRPSPRGPGGCAKWISNYRPNPGAKVWRRQKLRCRKLCTYRLRWSLQ